MTLSQLIRKYEKLEKRLTRIEGGMSGERYITAEEVKIRFGYSKKRLQLLRRDGIISDYTCDKFGPKESPRNFCYSVKELQSLKTKAKAS